MKEDILHGHSGAAARAVGIFEACRVAVNHEEKPTKIIGQSSGAILTALQGASYKYPCLMDAAIDMAASLDLKDMFPHPGNFPFNKKGKLSANAAFRVLTGHNHFAWQDISPMFKNIFKEKHLAALKSSGIECWTMGVDGKDGTLAMFNLNLANTVDDVLDMLKRSNRIAPFVQNYKGFLDGGFACYNPAWLMFESCPNLKKVRTFYAKEITDGIPVNEKWDKTIISIQTQTMLTATHWLSVKDAMIEELYCEKNNIDYVRIECPNGYTDEIYETDDDQLRALGQASREVALKAFKKDTNGLA